MQFKMHLKFLFKIFFSKLLYLQLHIKTAYIKYGVPHSSILGPLLHFFFFCFLKNVFSSLKQASKYTASKKFIFNLSMF